MFFSIVLRVYNLTDFSKSHVSSVRLDFTNRTLPRLIKANKITILRIKVCK
jgi:hypothetical protein